MPGSRYVLYPRAAEDAPLLFGLFDIDIGVRITPEDEDLTRELLQSFDVLPDGIRGRSAILRPGSIVFARKTSGSSRTTCSDATITRAP